MCLSSNCSSFSSSKVKHISSTIVKPADEAEHQVDVTRPEYVGLNAWALALLTTRYGQVGFLIRFIPRSNGPDRPTIIQSLKTALSAALRHFYPAAGRLHLFTAGACSLFVSLHCNGAGALFVHAAAPGATVACRLSAADDCRAFFPLSDAINIDGRSVPLVGIQVTDLDDGLFVGCSFNHAVADGRSLFQFMGSWLGIAGGGGPGALPVVGCWLPEGARLPITLPFRHPDEIIERFAPPGDLACRVFHFGLDSILRLKSLALGENGVQHQEAALVSTYQVLVAHMWRCMTRARRLEPEEETTLRVAIDNRPRVVPPLPDTFFGCCMQRLVVRTTAGELLSPTLGLGGVARKVRESVALHTHDVVRSWHDAWVASPKVRRFSKYGRGDVHIGGSARFDLSSDRMPSWGELVGYRMGPANRFDGKVWVIRGSGEMGSVDFEVTLAPQSMHALESDCEFLVLDGCALKQGEHSLSKL